MNYPIPGEKPLLSDTVVTDGRGLRLMAFPQPVPCAGCLKRQADECELCAKWAREECYDCRKISLRTDHCQWCVDMGSGDSDVVKYCQVQALRDCREWLNCKTWSGITDPH